MNKTFATLTALGALAITPALAQTSVPANPSSPPAMHAPAAPATPAEHSAVTSPSAATGNATTGNATTGMATASAKPALVDEQRPDQLLASSFKGTDVLGADGKKIGDVNDILFDRDGSIKAYVVGVGGFLGIGAKSVALAPNSFQVVPGKSPSDTKLQLSMNKDELKAASAFKPFREPTPASSTTGMSPAGANRPSGMPSSR